MRQVFLEKNSITGEYVTSNTYSAWQGFWLLGYECVPFTWEQMDCLDITKDTVVNGYIRTARKAFQILEIPAPAEVSIPDELYEFAGRKIWKSTLKEIRQHELQVFIKPLDGHKLFNGHLRTGILRDAIYTAPFPDDTRILVSEPVTFISEYRGFVLDGKLIGWKHYSGDFRKSPDISVVESAIKQYKTAPIAYSIDFGLDDRGRSLLVEVNDAFALGSYGLEHTLYARLIEARWDEIVGNT